MPEKRLSVEGKGGTKPLFDNATEAGRRANQRVEVSFEIPYSALVNMGKKPSLPPGASTLNAKKTVQSDKKKVSAKTRKSKPKTITVEDDIVVKKKKKTLGQILFGWMTPKKNKDKNAKEEDAGDDDPGN